MNDAAAIVWEAFRLGIDPDGPALEELEILPPRLVSRARCEAERARLLQLEREDQERRLLAVGEVEEAWGEACDRARAVLGQIPERFGQACPRLEGEDLEVVRELVAEALEGLEDAGLPPPPDGPGES